MDRTKLLTESLQGFAPGRLLDLGTRDGNFARAAVKLGWEVSAVDVRAGNFPKDGDEGVEYIEKDVRDMHRNFVKKHDVVACFGVFYHLTFEDQMELLHKLRDVPLLLETHVGTDKTEHPVGDEVLEMRNGLEIQGRWYPEVDSELASWGNDKSFWPTRSSLGTMLGHYGWDIMSLQEESEDRVYLVAVPAEPEPAPEDEDLV